MDPAGNFLYVPNTETNDISGFSIDTATGALAPLANSYRAGTTAGSIAIDASGKLVYVANDNSSNISIYSINPAVAD